MADQQVEETVTFRSEMGWKPEQFRTRRPVGVIAAIQYDGETFPLQFLERDEHVRLMQDGSRTLIGSVTGGDGQEWDMWNLRPGDWLARHPQLGLRVHADANWNRGYEPVEDSDAE
jgi:hypothetical protein